MNGERGIGATHGAGPVPVVTAGQQRPLVWGRDRSGAPPAVYYRRLRGARGAAPAIGKYRF